METKIGGNFKGVPNIGTEVTFNTEEAQQKFYAEQLSKVREIKAGESTWKDLNDLRTTYGYPDTNIDSIRRSFTQLANYDSLGWVRPPEDASIKGAIGAEKETISTDYNTGCTTSQKMIELTEEDARDKNKLLSAHGFNPDDWDLKSASNTRMRWSGRKGETVSYCSKITVIPKKIPYSDIKEVAKIFEDFKSPELSIKENNFDSKEYLLVPLYDMHWGRIPDEDDFAGYDVEKEKNRIIEHVKKYIDKFKDRKFMAIALVVGQDFLNSSFTGYTTSQSHMQDNALDFRTMFRTGSELLISIINMFAEISNNLYVIGSLGNHDTAEEVALFQLIKAYYRTCPNIIVDDSTRPRKYIDFGASCVGVGHLDKEKDRVYGLMQTEVPDIWARTKTHMFVAGHLHHFCVDSKQGVEVYRVPSICYRDRWTVEQGLVQNQPKTMCFIFDENEGLTETHFMYI